MVIDASTIYKLLPHKYPFLLIDRVIDVVPGESVVAIKNVSMNEPYFQGHFPGRPIVPGVLLLESLAQATAIMYIAEGLQAEGIDLSAKSGTVDISGIDFEKAAAKVGYLIDIKSVKFKKLVTPGDTLELHAIRKVKFGNLSQIKVEAKVDGESVVDGIISVSEQGE